MQNYFWFNVSFICTFVSSFIHLIFILQLPRATEYTTWTRQIWSLSSWGLLVLKRETEVACVLRIRRWEFGVFESRQYITTWCHSSSLNFLCSSLHLVKSFTFHPLKHSSNISFCDISFDLSNEVLTLKLLQISIIALIIIYIPACFSPPSSLRVPSIRYSVIVCWIYFDYNMLHSWTYYTEDCFPINVKSHIG